MISNKILAFVFFSVFALHSAHSAHHFTEVYSDGSSWRVDHFQIESGKLQEFVRSHSFPYEAQARQFASGIEKVNSSKSLSSIKLVKTEKNTIPLWAVKNAWNDEWEEKYSKWISENLDQNFFIKYQLATDCADVAYALRWIFARINNLPAVATLAGSGVEVSHLSAKAEWANLSTSVEWNKDQRFLAALNWLLDNVYTGTLYKDTYPVALTHKKIVAGLINLLGGHTEIFNKVSYSQDDLPLQVVSSTMPRAVRELHARPFFDNKVTDRADGGLVAFRWPTPKGSGWSAIAKESMPDYSLEQYQDTICEDEFSFARCLFKKLGMSFKPELVFIKTTKALEDSIKSREGIVNSGYAYCQTHDCSPGTVGWEDWGTPSRDKRLKQAFESAKNLSYSVDHDNEFYQWLKKTKISSDPTSPNYAWFSDRLKSGLVSYDPRNIPAARWAINSEAIRITVNSVVKNGEELRKVLIDKAQGCRDNANQCRKSEKDFQELSTVEVDAHVKGILRSWNEFCTFEKCSLDSQMDAIYEQVWKQSPLPWESLEQRYGRGDQTKDAHFLRASYIAPAFENYLILDGSKLYDIQSRKMVNLPIPVKNLGMLEELGVMFAFDGLDIHLLNSDLQVTATVKTNIKSTLIQIRKISKDIYLIIRPEFQGGPAPTPEQKQEAWLVNFSTSNSEYLGLFEQLVSDQRSDSTHIILQGLEVTKLISYSDNNFAIRDLAPFEGNVRFLAALKDKKYLLTTEGREKNILYELGPQGLRILMESDYYFKTFRVNDEFIFVSQYGVVESISLLIDSSGNIQEFGEEMEMGLSISDTQQFMTITKNNRKELSIIDLDGIKPLPVVIRENEIMIGATTKWISIANPAGGRTVSFDGQILEHQHLMFKGTCGQFFTSACKDNGELEVNYFPADFSGTRVDLNQVVRADNKQSLIYLLAEGSDDFGFGFGSGNGGYRWKSEKGFEIRLSDYALYWFPK